MKCKNCKKNDVYYYCVTCQKSGKNERDFLKHVSLETLEKSSKKLLAENTLLLNKIFELKAEIKGGYRFCDFCGGKTTLDDYKCDLCGHTTLLL